MKHIIEITLSYSINGDTPYSELTNVMKNQMS